MTHDRHSPRLKKLVSEFLAILDYRKCLISEIDVSPFVCLLFNAVTYLRILVLGFYSCFTLLLLDLGKV